MLWVVASAIPAYHWEWLQDAQNCRFSGIAPPDVSRKHRVHGQPSAQFAESRSGSQCRFAQSADLTKSQPRVQHQKDTQPCDVRGLQDLLRQQGYLVIGKYFNLFAAICGQLHIPAGAITMTFLFTTLKIVFSSTPISLAVLFDRPRFCNLLK